MWYFYFFPFLFLLLSVILSFSNKLSDSPPIHHQTLILLKLSHRFIHHPHPSSSLIHHRPHRRHRSSRTIAPKLTHRRRPTHHRGPNSSSSSPIFKAQLRSSIILRRSVDFVFGCVCVCIWVSIGSVVWVLVCKWSLHWVRLFACIFD